MKETIRAVETMKKMHKHISIDQEDEEGLYERSVDLCLFLGGGKY